ncbi:hypothetical protein PIB30_009765 [Stylosanthes scabra]|uniref:Uncharacterized protein n=1 Tax=Stylosanthes scabra TaxID=79078 RepID=A0ABU6X439_9FABA|nr:hypothetical protein [Stylosanthes scabra]
MEISPGRHESNGAAAQMVTPAADEVQLEIQISDPSDEEHGKNTTLKEKSNNSILLVRTIILLLTELYQRYRHQVLKEGFIQQANKEKQEESVDDHHPEKLVFRSHVYQKVIAIPYALRFALLTYCAIFLRDLLNNLVPFDLQKNPSPNSQPLLLSCSQAFFMFFPEIVQITIFALCCVVLILLVLPLHIELQIFILMFLVLPASLSYFPELARRASGVEIECATFRASLIRFVILWAVAFAFFLGLVILAALYLSWRHIFETRGPRKKGEKINLSDVLEAVA